MMKVVCAWCGKDMGEKMGPDGLTTHGMCKRCAENLYPKESPDSFLAQWTKTLTFNPWALPGLQSMDALAELRRLQEEREIETVKPVDMRCRSSGIGWLDQYRDGLN